MRVTSVDFDEDGDVEFVTIEVSSTEELRYIADTMGPEGLVFPVKMTLAPGVAADIFHKSGKVPGTHPDYDVSSSVYYSLMPVVDRLIEYDI